MTTVRGNSINGYISTESPIGKAILGKKEGERVLVRVNDQISYYVVVKRIDKTTTDENDKIRSY